MSRSTLGCSPVVNSELTQQVDGREKRRAAKRLCGANGTAAYYLRVLS